MKKQKGITIIALIITIILMLILATVSINVAINGGLFEKARDAVSSTEIASEKETVTQANILAKSKNKIVTVEDVQKALNSITDENSATAMDNGETIVVKFNKNDRYYEIENNNGVARISFCNSNIQNGVPIAIILQYGHGTGNGGWVVGRDYINPAIQPIFDEITKNAWKEVTKV